MGGGSNISTGKAPTLLNGLVRCGRCGKPMSTRNARAAAWPRYVCAAAKYEYGAPVCQGVQAGAVDRLIESLVLRAVQPAALELSLQATEGIERDRQRLHEQWRQKRERAEFEAGRARRQYDAVDPANRLVARELERQWEERLAERRRLEEGYARFEQAQPRHLTAQDRAEIIALATDVPALWHAATTTGADRRSIVRQLIEHIELTRAGASEVIALVLPWRGGVRTRETAYQGTHRYEQLGDYAGLQARIAKLRGEGLTGAQIAEVLNREGYRSPRGGAYNANKVLKRVAETGMNASPAGASGPEDLPGPGKWWLPDLARELGVDPIGVHQ